MPTNHDETLHERYIRENQAELDSLARMTPERISELAIELNNALAERDELRATIETMKASARRIGELDGKRIIEHNELRAELERVKKDVERMDLVEEYPNWLRSRKGKWCFVSPITNYPYSVFGTAREAIDASRDGEGGGV